MYQNIPQNLLVNLSGLVGYTGGHVLGNFSVTKQRGEAGTGFSAKLKDLQQGIKDYQVVVESVERSSPVAINSSRWPPKDSGMMSAPQAAHGSYPAWEPTPNPQKCGLPTRCFSPRAVAEGRNRCREYRGRAGVEPLNTLVYAGSGYGPALLSRGSEALGDPNAVAESRNCCRITRQ